MSTSLLRTVVCFLFKEAYFYADCLPVTARCAIRGLVDIHTIYLSQSHIPDAFLRGIGAPNSLIIYTRSLDGHTTDYYKCFISYTSRDETFVRRLYADLQSNGVRFWFAPHDMRIGDELRSRIDESIRLHDKLLLELSEHSLNNIWVKKEVETAFEKEEHDKKPV